ALWAGPFGLWAYFRFGRLSRQERMEAKTGDDEDSGRQKPFPVIVAIAATHCGAGCTLGDIIAEWTHYAFPFAIAGTPMFGAWVLDYVFAFSLGIAFQYFTIVPMRHLPFRQGLTQAL